MYTSTAAWEITPLTHDQQNSLQSCLINVTHIFIDEISMVGSTLAEYANIRLQEIFDCKKPFGGKHVIAISDFYQMKPVMDGYIFKNSGKHYTALAPNVWCDNFKIYSLTEIMHQKEEKNYKITDYKFNVRHIFPFANAVAAHNQKVFNQIHEYKVTIEAQDAVCGNPNEDKLRTAYYDLLTNKDHNERNNCKV